MLRRVNVMMRMEEVESSCRREEGPDDSLCLPACVPGYLRLRHSSAYKVVKAYRQLQRTAISTASGHSQARGTPLPSRPSRRCM